MRSRRTLSAVLIFLLLTLAAPLSSQEVGKHEVRYRIEFNLDLFPQKKPQEAVQSVVKAIGERKFGYLLAQLALPAEVDARVLRLAETFSKGSLEDKKLVAFEKVQAATADYFASDPDILKELRLFAGADTTWKEEADTASATHKDLPGRKIILRKLENRWFLENRSR